MFMVIYLVLLPYMGSLKGVNPNLGGGGYFRGPIGVLTVMCPWARCRAPPGPQQIGHLGFCEGEGI